MSRRSLKSKRLLALLLPLTLFCGWAACLAACADAAAHHERAQTIRADERCADVCAGELDDCPANAGRAAGHERRFVKSLASSPSPAGSASPSPAPRADWTVLVLEVRQNSPPGVAREPLFVRLCNLRI